MKKILFIQEGCDYCKEVLKDIIYYMDVEIMDLKKNIELAESFEIKSAPCLVVAASNPKRANIYVGRERIEKYLNN